MDDTAQSGQLLKKRDVSKYLKILLEVAAKHIMVLIAAVKCALASPADEQLQNLDPNYFRKKGKYFFVGDNAGISDII